MPAASRSAINFCGSRRVYIQDAVICLIDAIAWHMGELVRVKALIHRTELEAKEEDEGEEEIFIQQLMWTSIVAIRCGIGYIHLRKQWNRNENVLKSFRSTLDAMNFLGENVEIVGFSTSVAMKDKNIMAEQNDEFFFS